MKKRILAALLVLVLLLSCLAGVAQAAGETRTMSKYALTRLCAIVKEIGTPNSNNGEIASYVYKNETQTLYLLKRFQITYFVKSSSVKLQWEYTDLSKSPTEQRTFYLDFSETDICADKIKPSGLVMANGKMFFYVAELQPETYRRGDVFNCNPCNPASSSVSSSEKTIIQQQASLALSELLDQFNTYIKPRGMTSYDLGFVRFDNQSPGLPSDPPPVIDPESPVVEQEEPSGNPFLLNSTRMNMAYMLWTLCRKPKPRGSNSFTDIPKDSWYCDAVTWVTENGLMSGISQTLFFPRSRCTRRHIVFYIWRLAGCPDCPNIENPFSDVSSEEYALKAIIWAYSTPAIDLGVLRGDKFMPHLSPEAVEITDGGTGFAIKIINSLADPCLDGHTFGDWAQTVAPTCTSTGKESRVCKNCGEEETHELDKVDHVYNDWIQDTVPTCTEPGWERRVCLRCGKWQSHSIDPLGHQLENYICVRCGIDPSNPFEDVLSDKYYYKAIIWAYHSGITSGVDANHFGINMSCTRAQVVQFLWNAAGQPDVTASKSVILSEAKNLKETDSSSQAPQNDMRESANPFVDVKETDWFYKAVMWAVANGITNGTDATHFAPSKKCTRAEVVTFLRNASTDKEVSTTSNPFSDVKSTDWFYNSVLWAVENGITSGTTPTTFAPYKTCTRAEVVQFLYKAS